MNIILLQAGFPLVVILKNDSRLYYRVLAEADRGNPVPFAGFTAQAAQRSLDISLKILTPAKKAKEKFITLAELAKSSSFSTKYLNLLARTGNSTPTRKAATGSHQKKRSSDIWTEGRERENRGKSQEQT